MTRRSYAVSHLDASSAPGRQRKVATRLAILTLFFASLGACGEQGVHTARFAGQCPTASAPSPWIFETRNDHKDYFYGGFPHFNASLDALDVNAAASATPDSNSVFVTVIGCPDRNRVGYDVSPCGMHDHLVAGRRADEAQGRNGTPSNWGLRTDYFPYFSADDLSFVGRCDTANISAAIAGAGTCRVWMPEPRNTRGLYIVFTAAALPRVQTIVERARVFLSPAFSGCALS